MAEEIRSDRKISPVGRIFLVLGVVLLMAVAYVAAVMLQMPDEQPKLSGVSSPQRSSMCSSALPL